MSEWMSKWVDRVLLLLKVFPHWGHLKRRSCLELPLGFGVEQSGHRGRISGRSWEVGKDVGEPQEKHRTSTNALASILLLLLLEVDKLFSFSQVTAGLQILAVSPLLQVGGLA